MAATLCSEEGLELVHVEFVSESHHYFLRVYIDKPDGVTMADCTAISKQLGDILDVNLDLDVEYRLEVSSPGIYRPLFKKKDYLRFKGNVVEIRTVSKIMDKKKFTGILEGISEKDSVTLSVDGNTVEIDYSSIKSARLAENNGDDRC
ncbi:MAG: ribosome maturation factor RimP [Proteobacteria bacterium]|nr:ribosome maturation factor RimP [Pseudomonadota bacterium]